MTPLELVGLVAAGAVAGAVNAAAGGGSLLSFPSLLALGLTPLAANATSTLGLLAGGYGALFGYREELRSLRRLAWLVGTASVLGGIGGAVLLLALGGGIFAAMVPALLAGAAVLLLAQPLVSRALNARRAVGVIREPRSTWLFAVAFGVSLYGGYFGAGQGILFLGVMGAVLPRSLADVNVLKVLCANVNNTCAAVTFLVVECVRPTGAVVFEYALPLAAGSVLGGYYGVRLLRRLPVVVLRGFAASVAIAIAVVLLVRGA